MFLSSASYFWQLLCYAMYVAASKQNFATIHTDDLLIWENFRH